MRLSKVFRILTVVAWLLGLLASSGAEAANQGGIYVLKVKGTVNPALAGYIDRGLDLAEAREANLVVIQLDTPGGLADSMLDIVERMMAAQVPVAVYVSPAGAMAASAGVFITMSAHIAAMAPATSIGAAHPVAGGGSGELSPTMEEKVVNAFVAQIRSIAEERGRNIEWAEDAVRKSVSLQASEAVEQRVVDLMAPDLGSLLTQLNGQEVRMLGGRTVVLQTQGKPVVEVSMSLVESFLFTISNPTIAYILLSLGTTGLFFELASPGAIFPGVLGGICLILALFSLATLPIVWAGLLLIGLAFILFLAEIWVTSHGALAIGGVASFLFGSIILTSGSGPLFTIDPWAIGIVTGIISLFFVFVVGAVVRGHRRQITTGREGMVGNRAIVRVPLEPEGTVFLEGEAWRARLGEGRAEVGEEVVVTRVDGMMLWVRKSKTD